MFFLFSFVCLFCFFLAISAGLIFSFTKTCFRNHKSFFLKKLIETHKRSHELGVNRESYLLQSNSNRNVIPCSLCSSTIV